MSTRSSALAAGLAVLVLVVAARSAAAADAPAAATGEKIVANAVRMQGGPASTGRLMVTVDSYTTDEETKKWIEIFAKGGQDALVEAWQKEKPVAGRMRFATTLGYDLRVARSRPTENGGRRIILVTDRPIQGFELRGGLRSSDYPIAWIQLEVDAQGKGEGTMVPTAQLSVKDGSLVIESYGSQPVRLLNVEVTKE